MSSSTGRPSYLICSAGFPVTGSALQRGQRRICPRCSLHSHWSMPASSELRRWASHGRRQKEKTLREGNGVTMVTEKGLSWITVVEGERGRARRALVLGNASRALPQKQSRLGGALFMKGMLAPQHTEFVAHVYIAQAEAALEAFVPCLHCLGWQGVDGRDGAVLVGVAQGEGGLDALVERSAPSMPVEGLLPRRL